MTELCAEFEISRKTDYKWLTRYRARGPAGLYERSRAPQRVPWAITNAQAKAIVGVRRAHPSWGPKKLRVQLSERAPHEVWPAPSTIGELLRRRGLTRACKRRRHTVPNPAALTVAVAGNDLWCIDFKGWFRTGDGARCDPLTVSDAFSRYLLCAQALAHPDYAGCHAQLERVFREYGLPRAIRSDNGAPFAALGAGGLSRLSVWWVKLRITPERIAPRKHRTAVMSGCTRPSRPKPGSRPPPPHQQRRFEYFRHEFRAAA